MDTSILNSTTFDENNYSALHLAVIKKNPKITQMLLNDFNADVDFLDAAKNTPLHYSCDITLRIILQARPKLHEAKNDNGESPMQLF